MTDGMDGDPFRKSTKDRIYNRQNGYCHPMEGCGKPLDRGDAEFHHVVPKAWGGPDIDPNGVALHSDCHKKRTKERRGYGWSG